MKTRQARREGGRVPAAHVTQRSKGSENVAGQNRANQAIQQGAVPRAVEPGPQQPIQLKPKPDDEVLKAAVVKFVAKGKGTCCAMSSQVYTVLAGYVDDKSGETGAALMTWAENEGTEDQDIGNHTAATAIWGGEKYVVDTTCGQFGGADIYIGKVADWQAYILDLQKAKISHPIFECQSRPYTDGDMEIVALKLGEDITFEKPTRRIDTLSTEREESKEVKKPAKEEPKTGGPKKSRCYLTTACVQHRGLDDDCRELTVLRAFRDGYLSAQPHGPALIGEYYRHAPRLVRSIYRSPNANRTWEWIYRVIRGCVRDIARGRPAQAETAYRVMVAELLAAFPPRRAGVRVRLLR